MGGLSSDPAKRARSLANLRRSGPPAPRGNSFAATHGAYARITEVELDRKTREIFAALALDAPVRAADGGLPAHDALVVRMLAENRVRRERCTASEIRHGIEERDGRVRPVVEIGLRLDDQALALAKELGMTPRSRAALGLDLARAEIDWDAHLRKLEAD